MRLAACLDISIDVIGPTAFDMSDRALKRSGMDYLQHVALTKHKSFEHFEEQRAKTGARLILATTKSDLAYTDFKFSTNDHILMGRESAGVPDEIHNLADERITIPMSKNLRSINVALSAAMIIGEALRQFSADR